LALAAGQGNRTTQVPERIDFNQIARALLDESSPFWANVDGLNLVLLRREDLPEDLGTAREAVDELLAAMRRFAESTSHGAKLAVATRVAPVPARSSHH
jgi:hypothetical protein